MAKGLPCYKGGAGGLQALVLAVAWRVVFPNVFVKRYLPSPRYTQWGISGHGEEQSKPGVSVKPVSETCYTNFKV